MSQATQTPAGQGPGAAGRPAATRAGEAGAGAGAAGQAVPDLLYSTDETDLRGAVRSVLEDQAGWREVLARTESGQPYDTGLWHTVAAEVGCAGLLVPESLGGAGASYREAAVVAEELGRAAAPVPFLGSAVVATTALLVAGEQELLRQVASGEVTAALAVPFAAGPAGLSGPAGPSDWSGSGGQVPAPTVRLTGPVAGDGDQDGGYRLAGSVTGIADALTAGVLLVPADGVPYGLYAVQVSDPGVTMSPVTSLDMTRQLGDLTLDSAVGRRIATGDTARAAVAAALTAGAGVLASEQLGMAERCLEMTVAYVRERRQFARPVGSFQAIKHRLADWWVAVIQARAAARYAATCLAAGDPDTAVAVAVAKATCSDVALKAAQETIQLHGGIGFTWEHPAHLYLKRAKADSIGFGTADAHRASLAALADLPAPGGA